MKKSLKILMLLLFCSHFSFAQEKNAYKPNFGETHTGEFKDNNLIGVYENHYYFLLKQKKNYKIYKFTLNHELVSTDNANFTFADSNKSANEMIGKASSQIVRTEDNTFLYSVFIDKKNNAKTIYSSRFKDGNFEPGKKLGEYDFEVERNFSVIKKGGTMTNWSGNSYPGYYQRENSNPGFYQSSNKKRVVYSKFSSKFDMSKMEWKKDMRVFVFDENSELLWSKEQKIPNKDKNIEIIDRKVDNDGSVYIVAKYFEYGEAEVEVELKKEKIKTREEFVESGLEHFVFKITESGFEEFKIDDLNRKLVELKINLLDNSNDIFVAGYYGEMKRNGQVLGLFASSGNTQSGFEISKTHEFEKEFIEKRAVAKHKKGDKFERESKTYQIGTFVNYEDGTIGVLSEFLNVITGDVRDNGGNKQPYESHFYGEILIPRFTKDCELVKMTVIPKSYKYEVFVFSDKVYYRYGVENEKIYLLYNTQISEEEGEKTGIDYGPQHSDFVVINKDGEKEIQKVLCRFKDERNRFFSENFEVKHGNLFFSTGGKSNKYTFGLIKL